MFSDFSLSKTCLCSHLQVCCWRRCFQSRDLPPPPPPQPSCPHSLLLLSLLPTTSLGGFFSIVIPSKGKSDFQNVLLLSFSPYSFWPFSRPCYFDRLKQTYEHKHAVNKNTLFREKNDISFMFDFSKALKQLFDSITGSSLFLLKKLASFVSYYWWNHRDKR